MFSPYLSDLKYKFSLIYNREQYDNILEDPNSKIGIFLNRFIVFLIFLSIGILFLESIPEINYEYSKELYYLDFFVSTVFLLEYLYRFSRSLHKINFIFRPLNIIDFLAFFPFFVSFIITTYFQVYQISGEFLKVLRLARVFRILKLAKHIPVISGFVKSLKDYKDEYKGIMILFFMILSVFSMFVYQLEHIENPKMFSSMPQAMWWGLVTMATVGYGDAYPITPMGKMVGSMLIVLGPVLLAILSSITILVFMDVAEAQREKLNRGNIRLCHRCKNRNPRGANYCMKCGEMLVY